MFWTVLIAMVLLIKQEVRCCWLLVLRQMLKQWCSWELGNFVLYYHKHCAHCHSRCKWQDVWCLGWVKTFCWSQQHYCGAAPARSCRLGKAWLSWTQGCPQQAQDPRLSKVKSNNQLIVGWPQDNPGTIWLHIVFKSPRAPGWQDGRTSPSTSKNCVQTDSWLPDILKSFALEALAAFPILPWRLYQGLPGFQQGEPLDRSH